MQPVEREREFSEVLSAQAMHNMYCKPMSWLKHMRVFFGLCHTDSDATQGPSIQRLFIFVTCNQLIF